MQPRRSELPLGGYEPIDGLAHARIVAVAELNQKAHDARVGAGAGMLLPDHPLARNPAAAGERTVLALEGEHVLAAPPHALVIGRQP